MVIPVSLAAASAALLTLSGCARQNPGYPKAVTKAADKAKDAAEKAVPSTLDSTGPSNDEQIETAMKDAKHDIKNGYSRLGYSIRSGDKIPEDLSASFLVIFKGGKSKAMPLMKLIDSPKFVLSLKKDDSCVDGSVRLSGELCFNASELKKTSPANLRAVILAQAARQIAQIYEQDDAIAAKTQTFFLENRSLVSPTEEVLAKLPKFQEETIDAVRKLSLAIQKRGPDEAICPTLANLKASVDNVVSLGTDTAKLRLPGRIMSELIGAQSTASKALGFCGSASTPIKGDRLALIDLITKFGDQQNDSANHLAKFVNSESTTVYHTLEDASMLLVLGAYKALYDQKSAARSKQVITEKEVGCRITDDNSSTAGYPVKIVTQNVASQVIYSFSKSQQSGSDKIEISALLRDRALPSDVRSGLEFRLEARKNGELINKNIKVTGLTHALVAYDAAKSAKVPTSILRKGEREAFQVRFKLENHSYALRCELLKDAKQSPESVKISTDEEETSEMKIIRLETTAEEMADVDDEEQKLVEQIRRGSK